MKEGINFHQEHYWVFVEKRFYNLQSDENITYLSLRIGFEFVLKKQLSFKPSMKDELEDIYSKWINNQKMDLCNDPKR